MYMILLFIAVQLFYGWIQTMTTKRWPRGARLVWTFLFIASAVTVLVRFSIYGGWWRIALSALATLAAAFTWKEYIALRTKDRL